jgi:LPPG:FO 2-phospho-L-lactate transferase
VRFDGAVAAQPLGLRELCESRAVVIAPSNPIVSIGPVRALDGFDATLAARRETVVAVSPIVADTALKGPADRMLTELGHEATVVGVARLYAPIAGTLVVDTADAALAPQVEAAGMRCVVADTVMKTPEVAASLTRTCLAAVGVTA